MTGHTSNGGQPPLPQRFLQALLLLLLVAYPLTLHLGILSEHLLPAVAILLGLLFVSGLLMLIKGNPYGWLPPLAAITILGGYLLKDADPGLYLKLLPILINGMLCILFSATLLPGQKPLIARFAEIIHAHALDDLTRRYTRRVTILWSSLFAGMMLESLLLAWLASAETWSLFTNFINYLLVLLVFIVEYQYRIRRLSHLHHPGFFGFLVSLRRIEWRKLL
jgi:uncharacterized membrane protein